MNPKSYPFIIFTLVITIIACTPEQEIIDDSPGDPLLFSTDTVLFDTLFTTVGSVTRRLRILNENEHAISIDNISLAGGAASPYNIFVNGDKGFSFNDVVIFGILIAILAVLFWTHSLKNRIAKTFYNIFPLLLLCYFVPSLLTLRPPLSRNCTLASRGSKRP